MMTRLQMMLLGLAGTLAASVLGAQAAPADSAQRVPVTLRWHVAEGLLTLTATTPRRGLSRLDRWCLSPPIAFSEVMAAEASSRPSTSYVSRATVQTVSLVPDTTYTFSYSIVMKAAENAWVGSASVTITIGAERSF